MKKWINKETKEEFVGDTLGTISVSYNEHTNETSFYLGCLNVVALAISGELDDEEVEQYIQDYLADWETVEETTVIEVVRKFNSGSHLFELTFDSTEDAQNAITSLQKSSDVLSVKIKESEKPETEKILQQRLSTNNMFFRVGDSVVIDKDADFTDGDPIVEFVGKRVTIKTIDEEKEMYTVEELPHGFIDADFDTSACILASN